MRGTRSVTLREAAQSSTTHGIRLMAQVHGGGAIAYVGGGDLRVAYRGDGGRG